MRRIAAILFPGFELLDLYGPLEMFGLLPERYEIRMTAMAPGPVPSGMGPKGLADQAMAEAVGAELLLVPGGPGTRPGVEDRALLDALSEISAAAELTLSVCTGSALLARAGILDGRRATSNKNAWDWVTAQGPKVAWQRRARWVGDGAFVTSSGVSAGMDMALAVIARLGGVEAARQAARNAEYRWQEDPSDDPFA